MTERRAKQGALAMLNAGADMELLLTDIALVPAYAGRRSPGGGEKPQYARARPPDVLLSGFSEEPLDADRDAPSTWVLPKPCTRQQLGQAITRVMAHDSPS